MQYDEQSCVCARATCNITVPFEMPPRASPNPDKRPSCSPDRTPLGASECPIPSRRFFCQYGTDRLEKIIIVLRHVPNDADCSSRRVASCTTTMFTTSVCAVLGLLYTVSLSTNCQTISRVSNLNPLFFLVMSLIKSQS